MFINMPGPRMGIWHDGGIGGQGRTVPSSSRSGFSHAQFRDFDVKFNTARLRRALQQRRQQQLPTDDIDMGNGSMDVWETNGKQEPEDWDMLGAGSAEQALLLSQDHSIPSGLKTESVQVPHAPIPQHPLPSSSLVSLHCGDNTSSYASSPSTSSPSCHEDAGIFPPGTSEPFSHLDAQPDQQQPPVWAPDFAPPFVGSSGRRVSGGEELNKLNPSLSFSSTGSSLDDWQPASQGGTGGFANPFAPLAANINNLISAADVSSQSQGQKQQQQQQFPMFDFSLDPSSFPFPDGTTTNALAAPSTAAGETNSNTKTAAGLGDFGDLGAMAMHMPPFGFSPSAGSDAHQNTLLDDHSNPFNTSFGSSTSTGGMSDMLHSMNLLSDGATLPHGLPDSTNGLWSTSPDSSSGTFDDADMDMDLGYPVPDLLVHPPATHHGNHTWARSIRHGAAGHHAYEPELDQDPAAAISPKLLRLRPTPTPTSLASRSAESLLTTLKADAADEFNSPVVDVAMPQPTTQGQGQASAPRVGRPRKPLPDKAPSKTKTGASGGGRRTAKRAGSPKAKPKAAAAKKGVKTREVVERKTLLHHDPNHRLPYTEGPGTEGGSPFWFPQLSVSPSSSSLSGSFSSSSGDSLYAPPPASRTTRASLHNTNTKFNVKAEPPYPPPASYPPPPAPTTTTTSSGRSHHRRKTLPSSPAAPAPTVLPLTPAEQRSTKNKYLLEAKQAGLTYKEIRRKGGFTEAESTLRGRYRTLTKAREERVRKPEWTRKDLCLLEAAVRKLAKPAGLADLRAAKVPWKQVAEYIHANGGTYLFGSSTCRKRWDDMVHEAERETGYHHYGAASFPSQQHHQGQQGQHPTFVRRAADEGEAEANLTFEYSEYMQ